MKLSDFVDSKKRESEGWSGNEILGEAVFNRKQKDKSYSPTQEELDAEEEYLKYKAPKPQQPPQPQQKQEEKPKDLDNSFWGDLMDFSPNSSKEDSATKMVLKKGLGYLGELVAPAVKFFTDDKKDEQIDQTLQNMRDYRDTSVFENPQNSSAFERGVLSTIADINNFSQGVKDWAKEQDNFLSPFIYGVADTFLPFSSENKAIKQYKNKVEAIKDAKNEAIMSIERKQEYEKIKKEFDEAKGFNQIFKASINTLKDTITHPQEWTIEGMTNFATDPTNLMGGFTGFLSNMGKGVFTKILSSSIAGMTENALVGTAYDTGIAYGEGKRGEELQKQSLSSFISNSTAGAGLGGVGGAIRVAVEGKSNNVINDSNAIKDNNVINDNKSNNDINAINDSNAIKAINDNNVIKQDEADKALNQQLTELYGGKIQPNQNEIQAKQREILSDEIGDLAENLKESNDILNLYKRNAVEKTQIPIIPSEKIIKWTTELNGGQEVSNPKLLGTGILDVINTEISLNRFTPDELRNKLSESGWREDVVESALKSYESKNIAPLQELMSAKIQNAINSKISQATNLVNNPKALEKIIKVDDIAGDLGEGFREKLIYKVVSASELKPTFEAGAKTQKRFAKQDNVIQNIQENFDAVRHFRGFNAFDGMPIVDFQNNIIAGNHRGQAFKAGLSEKSRKAYNEGAKKYFGENVFEGLPYDDPIIVRELVSTNPKNIENLSAMSNLNRVYSVGEKSAVLYSQWRDNIQEIINSPHTDITNREELKLRVADGTTKITADEAGMAVIYGLDPNISFMLAKYEDPINSSFAEIFYRNSYNFLNMQKIARSTDQDIDIVPYLAGSLERMMLTKEGDARDLAKESARILNFYKEKFLDGVIYPDELGGDRFNSFTFKQDMLGILLRYISSRLDGGVSNLADRMKVVMTKAQQRVAQANSFDFGENSNTRMSFFDTLKILMTEKMGEDEGNTPVKTPILKEIDGVNWGDIFSKLIDKFKEEEQKIEQMDNSIIEENAKDSRLFTHNDDLIPECSEDNAKSYYRGIDEYLVGSIGKLDARVGNLLYENVWAFANLEKLTHSLRDAIKKINLKENKSIADASNYIDLTEFLIKKTYKDFDAYDYFSSKAEQIKEQMSANDYYKMLFKDILSKEDYSSLKKLLDKLEEKDGNTSLGRLEKPISGVQEGAIQRGRALQSGLAHSAKSLEQGGRGDSGSILGGDVKQTSNPQEQQTPIVSNDVDSTMGDGHSNPSLYEEAQSHSELDSLLSSTELFQRGEGGDHSQGIELGDEITQGSRGHHNNREHNSGVDSLSNGEESTRKSSSARRTQSKPTLSIEQKRELQRRAESKSSLKLGDIEDIEADLPYLLEGQIEDVEFAEKRFGNGRGVLFTNQTGTGKTLTGLGIVKRFLKRGLNDVLIVVPSDGKIKDWVEEAQNLLIDVKPLEDRKDGGSGVSITTYANFYANSGIKDKTFNLIVYDESHKILGNKEGEITETYNMHKNLTWNNYAKKADVSPYTQKPEEIAKIKEQIGDDRVVFLSATPFSSVKSLLYGDRLLFEMGDYEEFFVRNFGYRIRYNKLTRPESGVNVGALEREFADRLKSEGVMRGRKLEIESDYSRQFMRVPPLQLDKVDSYFDLINKEDYKIIAELYSEKFRYHYINKINESVKAKGSIPLIKEAIKNGDKVVVFHNYNKGGVEHPFILRDDVIESHPYKRKAREQYEKLQKEKPELFEPIEFENPLDIFEKEFGKQVVFYNGTIPTKERNANVKKFNDDDSEVKIIVVQSDAGGTGISLHDKTGKHRRINVNLGIPVKHIVELQKDGRTRRHGQKSNTAYIYPISGTRNEQFVFGSGINQAIQSTENLALGNEARNMAESLKDAYIQGLERNLDYSQVLDFGGKESEAGLEKLTPWELAKSRYYSTSKGRKNNLGEDFFETPDPIGLKMSEFADLKWGDKVLEPSAGRGAIAQWFGEGLETTALEPSSTLRSELMVRMGGEKRRVLPNRFEDLSIVNKFDSIVMNPPYGKNSKVAIEHLNKAITHLRENGRIVALLPDSNKVNARLAELITDAENPMTLVGQISLPSSTFNRAGTSVMTQIVILDKREGFDNTLRLDLSSLPDNERLFERMENLQMPEKIRENEAIPEGLVSYVNEAGEGVVQLERYTPKSEWRIINDKMREMGGSYNSELRGWVFKDKEAVEKFKAKELC